MKDDEFDRRLRAADPAGARSNAPLTPPRRAQMERIMAEPVGATRYRTWGRGRLRWSLAAVPLGAIAVIALFFGFFSPVAPTPTYAYGPAPLVYQSVDESLDDVVRAAQQRLADGSQADAERRSSSVAWNLVITDLGEPEEVSVISPEVRDLVWAEDLSATRTIREGEPFAVDATDHTPAASLEVGAVRNEEQFSAGEYPAYLLDAGGLDEAYARDLLTQYAPFDSETPGDALWGIADILNEWTLTDAQHGQMLDVLSEYTGISVIGTTEDRLGRPVVGIEGRASGGYLSTLFISTETGRIVGVESAVASTDTGLPVPAGTITSYTLWKDPR